MRLLEFFRRKKKETYEEARPREDAYAPLFAKEDEVYMTSRLDSVDMAEKGTGGRKRAEKGTEKGTVSWKHRAVELCEELIDASRCLEDQKSEYQLVTEYLNDIQKLEELSEEQYKPIEDSARQIAKLDSARNEYLNTERRIPDVKFSQFQEEESEMPGIIQRFQSNEAYLEAINRDLRLLEGEKMEWNILKEDSKHSMEVLRKLSIVMFVFFFVWCLLLLILSYMFEFDSQLYMLLTAFFAVIFAAFVIVHYQNAGKEIKRCEVNRNQAISLENHVKIKYVNIKNAVDYTCEKYQVKNSYELIYQYEQYQEMVKERAKFRQTSDDLIYYTDRLIRRLESLNLYDARVWLHYLGALLDRKEMSELKQRMLVRREKIWKNMEEQRATIQELREGVEEYIYQSGDDMKQIRVVLSKLDDIDTIKPFSYN